MSQSGGASTANLCDNGHVFIYSGYPGSMPIGFPCQCGKTKWGSKEQPMSIQRYDPWWRGEAMDESDSGEFVLYSDHLEAIRKEREELVKWLRGELLKSPFPNPVVYGHVIAHIGSLGK